MHIDYTPALHPGQLRPRHPNPPSWCRSRSTRGSTQHTHLRHVSAWAGGRADVSGKQACRRAGGLAGSPVAHAARVSKWSRMDADNQNQKIPDGTSQCTDTQQKELERHGATTPPYPVARFATSRLPTHAPAVPTCTHHHLRPAGCLLLAASPSAFLRVPLQPLPPQQRAVGRLQTAAPHTGPSKVGGLELVCWRAAWQHRNRKDEEADSLQPDI